MTRFTTLLVAVFMVVGTLAGPATAFAEPAPAVSDDAINAVHAQNETSNASEVAPGELLSGVLGVTKAEVDGEMKTRTFGVKVAMAATNESKADVVAEQLEEIKVNLTELQDRKQRLQEARENSSISKGEYRAKMATTVAEINTVKQLLNATNRTASKLPADVLAEKGINVSAIQTLKNRADNLTGPQVAKIARSIAGPSVGKSIAKQKAPVNISIPEQAGPPEDRGPSNETGNESKRGPPEDRGPGGDDSNGESNRSDGQTTTEEGNGSETTTTEDGGNQGESGNKKRGNSER